MSQRTSDEEIQNIINILYKKAALEDTFGVNINCINNGKPEVMGLKKILKVYTDFKYGLYDTKYRKLLAQQEEIHRISSSDSRAQRRTQSSCASQRSRRMQYLP